MTLRLLRLIKAVLLVLFLVSGAYVGYYLWEGIDNRKGPSRDLDEPETLTSRGVELEQLDEDGQTTWILNAAESVGNTDSGNQRFRDVTIRFNAGSDKKPVVVTADDCEIGKRNAVKLRGNVIVHDDTTLRLEADALEFGRFPDRVWSTTPVRYWKDGLRGTAGRMHYVIKRGELDFDEGVDMTLQEEGSTPIRVTSASAAMKRNQHWVQYVDNVLVRQTRQTLRANDLQLFLDEGNQHLVRVEAAENVDFRMHVRDDSPDEPESADSEDADGDGDDDEDARMSLANEPGLKRLLTERLEMVFRPGGEELERARAFRKSRLIMRLPRDATKGYDKVMEGNVLAFVFDENGEIQNVRGRGGVRMVLTPREGGEAEQKIVRSRQLASVFDTETGELIEARCIRSVEFEQGDVRASSELAVLQAEESLLTLTDKPRLWDPRASLEARQIQIQIETGDVTGEGDVRSSSLDDSGGAGIFPAAEKEPVYFVSEHVVYDRKSELAVYTGSARGFQGKNRVEAETIRIHQEAGDLLAEGGVRTVFLQELVAEDGEDGAESSGGSDGPKPTITDAASLHYRAEKDLLEYREDVQMRSEELTLKSGSVDVMLGEDGDGVKEIYAEENVEIETPDGKAAGSNARYLPEDKSMTIQGEEAWLENDGKLTQGKQLTFFLTNDRILVDGQEQNRTKTTYSSRPRP